MGATLLRDVNDKKASRGGPDMAKGRRVKKMVETEVVRIEKDLARKAAAAAAVLGVSVSDLLSPFLRPYIEKKYAEAGRKIVEETSKPPKASDEK